MKFRYIILPILLCGCAEYHSPAHEAWGTYLRGASFTDMNEVSRMAKRPVYVGAGGQVIDDNIIKSVTSDFGKNQPLSDNAINVAYMSKLEYELYDALRKPGISVQRAGSDVVVILVRDAIMELNAPDISETGDDTLKTISAILKKYNATFIEIAGYTDAMRNSAAANTLSMDMAQRVGVYLAQHDILPARMFIVGRGASRPIAAQDDIGRLTNRRVEIRISPAR
ncbi:MAG: OmpA family protein [Proteobacteria bacterium]|nr:OmpA family protein [Candidatus Enterousia scatequi]